MRQRFQRFMAGRYGADELSKTLNTVVIVCLVLSFFSAMLPILSVLYWVGVGLMVYNTYRMFSRNFTKRRAENQKFLNARYQATAKKNARKKRFEQRKIYRFYKCPSCKQRVRVPKGRGKICITCPKCRTEFIKRS